MLSFLYWNYWYEFNDQAIRTVNTVMKPPLIDTMSTKLPGMIEVFSTVSN